MTNVTQLHKQHASAIDNNKSLANAKSFFGPNFLWGDDPEFSTADC